MELAAWLLGLLGLGWLVRRMDNGGWLKVWTTTFGSQGLASGGTFVTERDVLASLPSTTYLGREIDVQAMDDAGVLGPVVRMRVRDVGPHYVDDPYADTGERPLAEYTSGRVADPDPSRTAQRLEAQREPFRSRAKPRQAGALDLSVAAWRELGVNAPKPLNFSGWARWRFAA